MVSETSLNVEVASPVMPNKAFKEYGIWIKNWAEMFVPFQSPQRIQNTIFKSKTKTSRNRRNWEEK